MDSQKQEVISKFKTHEGDTGSPDVQIALITSRIAHLEGHFKNYAKDHQSRRGLLKLVGQRRRLLKYLKRSHADRYARVTTNLGLRREGGEGGTDNL